jgi:RNA recognition motif-containing protein
LEDEFLLDEEDIYQVFHRYGHVLDVIVPEEENKIAYVVFGDIISAHFATKHLDGFTLANNKV